MLRVYSGQCCVCDVGIKTGETDMGGNDLYTGDIVQLWHGYWVGEDFEEWMPSDGLTVVLADQYESYSDGTVKTLSDSPTPFTMGIKCIGVQGGDWRVKLVKSHNDIVPGERFPAFGINYREQ